QIELVCGDRLIRVRYFDELHIISLHLQHTALRRARLARPVAVGGALGGYQELRSRAFIRGSDEDEQRVVVWKEVSRLERLLRGLAYFSELDLGCVAEAAYPCHGGRCYGWRARVGDRGRGWRRDRAGGGGGRGALTGRFGLAKSLLN